MSTSAFYTRLVHMGFEERARKCCERGDFVRAVIVLVEGLKRHPERASSLDFLLQTYTEDCESPGLERDILDALVKQPDCSSLVGQVCVRLEEQGKSAMMNAIMQLMRERRIEIIWPPTPVEPKPVEADTLPSLTEKADADNPEHLASPDHPQVTASGNSSSETSPEHSAENESSFAAEQKHTENSITDSANDKNLTNIAHIATSVPRVRADISAEIQIAKDAIASADASSEQRIFIRNEHVTPRQNRAERSRVHPKKSDSNKPKHTQNSRTAALLVVAVLLAIISGLALYRWDDLRISSRITRIDSMLAHFDPENFQAFENTIQDATNLSVGENRPLTERRQFAIAVRNSESGPYPAEKPDDEPVSHWGAGALVLWAIEANDIERALSETVKLEFTYPDSLSALWVRARLMEHLGDSAAAHKHYEQTAQHYPNFIPSYLGLARLSARRFDLTGWQAALNSLNKVSSKHPYHTLNLDSPIADALFTAGKTQTPESAEQREQISNDSIQHGRFYAAMRKYNLALDALANNEFAAARTLAEQAAVHDPTLRIALVLLGALEAIAHETTLASESFRQAVAEDVNLQNTSLELRLLVQYIAPITLTASGRADVALTFTSPVAPSPTEPVEANLHQPSPIDKLVQELQARRPTSLDFQAAEHFETHPIARKALLARAFTLNALGASHYLPNTLPETNDDPSNAQSILFERFVATVVSNHHQEARRQLNRMADDSVERNTSEAILAHLEARFAEAIEFANAAYAARPDVPFALRPLVLSLIESGKGREAVTILEQARLAPVWNSEFESLRTRVYARMGMREMLSADILDPLKDGNTPPEKFALNQQIDQLAAALWLRQNNTARDLITRLSTEPDHPEWKWTAGLYFRGVGDQDRAASLFKKSWRKDQNKPELLVELGSIHLEFERYELAQEAFYAAILRDRGNIQALSGISQTYLAYDRPRGRRDVARMLANLGTTAQFGPQRAELRKWLAVLHGLRDGEPAALPFIEKAQQEVGDRADLLIELARYHEARQEYAIARIHYANALQKNSTLPDAHYGLAQMAIHAGDYRVARDHLKRFIALTPEGKIQAEAQAQLAQIQTKSSQ